jgi:hypothetical protein
LATRRSTPIPGLKTAVLSKGKQAITRLSA